MRVTFDLPNIGIMKIKNSSHDNKPFLKLGRDDEYLYNADLPVQSNAFTVLLEVEGSSLVFQDFDADGRAVLNGMEVQRTLTPLPGGLGVQVAFHNGSSSHVALQRIVVFSTQALFGSQLIEGWKVFRLARQKNDIAGIFDPGVSDHCMEDACFDSSEIVAGYGVQVGSQADSDKLPCIFNADPGIVVERTMEDTHKAFFIGFSGQSLHLNNIRVVTSEDRRLLNELSASAEFGGVSVYPGESRVTHTCVMQAGRTARDLLDAHAERVALVYGVNGASKKKPAVFCSWYFYGPEFTEADLHENLVNLRGGQVPFDVFQIDNGWMDTFGDWNARIDRFPSGMEDVAGKIRQSGMIPGIWTCPFVLDPSSVRVKEQPELILRNRSGNPCVFTAEGRDCFVLDPFADSAKGYLTDTFVRLKKWGYGYHKLDWLRALLRADAIFAKPGRNCAEACRYGLEIIREALGPDAYISACGGLFEGSAGLVDSNRSGMDVRGHWDGGKTRFQNYVIRMKQNIARNFYNPLWHTDPDALQLRRRTEGWLGNDAMRHLSMGTFNDEEAFSTVVNQFLGGGIVCVSEKIRDIDADRKNLYRHVIPQYAPPARYFPEWTGYLPELFSTAFPEPENGLDPWVIVSMANWAGDTEKLLEFRISEVPGLPHGQQFHAFELHGQRYLGRFDAGDLISLKIPAHGTRLIRLCGADTPGPVLLGTNVNFSSGMELCSWRIGKNTVSGQLGTDVHMSITLTMLIPSTNGPVLKHRILDPVKKNFIIRWGV